ncbi:hypothetical protein [Myxacorys almedinensis]|uniref:Uncharacterized protein n=1 Tax=Myxacorys almedinensis A TaxID=2690445 RepID=A0A8J7Z0F8_9CYAN|nr:hypothetical protein [Myxacorys almedinensis]NDJ16795.1 hypothetical protein [Myxacorys almedinensis A]
MPKSWRGYDGEDDMTDEDVMQRGGEQARAMLQGGDAFTSSLDDDGKPTGGCYNMDYPQSWHDECNQRLEQDEYYEAQTEKDLQELYVNWDEEES